jgi:hypothetical protein
MSKKRDTTPPTVIITSTETSPSPTNPIPLTFTLSKVSVDFAIGDLTIGAGGSIGNFAGSGTSYTADLTVATAGATITVDIAANSFHDVSGNGNTAATQFSITSSVQLLDNFTTAAGAPLSSPHTSEPGPGTITLTDPNSKNTIAGGVFKINTDTANNVRGFFTPASALVAGRAYFVNVIAKAGGQDIKLGTVFENGAGGYMEPSGYMADPGGNIGNIVSGLGKYGFVRTTGGQIYYIKDNKLIWPYIRAITGTWGLTARTGNTTSTMDLDNLKIVDFGAPFVADYGIATSRSATSSAGETKTHEADAIVEHTITAATGVTQELMFRRTDDSNTWIVRLDQAGSRIYLYEKNAGVETERGATGGVAQTQLNGIKYRIVVICDSTTIYVCSGVATGNVDLKITYASATYNQSATGAKVDRIGENFICWPRTLSGAALTEYQRCYPF